MNHRRTTFTLVVAIGIGLVGGFLLLPRLEEGRALRRLFSEQATDRTLAQNWFLPPGQPPRMAEDERLFGRVIETLSQTESSDIFLDAASIVRESGLWDVEHVTVELWCRRWSQLLELDGPASAESAIEALSRLPHTSESDAVDKLWLQALSHGTSPETRERWLMGVSARYGMERAEPFVARLIDDPEARLRRFAWLLMAHINPVNGYAARWQDEPAEVAEAILWAAISTNPDHVAPLLEAVETTPWPTPLVPYLLSRSTHIEAQAALSGLVADGNPDAMIPVAERGAVESMPTPEYLTAWLGRGSEPLADPILKRWWCWRRAAWDKTLEDDPVAEDGSVANAVLLAVRAFEPNDAAALSFVWLQSLEDDTKCAGALLAGLTGAHWEELEICRGTTRNVRVKRAATLALMMQKGSSGADVSSRAYAWRLVNEPDGVSRDEALFALLALGDREASLVLFDVAPQESARAALLQKAWWLEWFFPREVALVSPLSPWDDEVARLQWDIMRTHAALVGE